MDDPTISELFDVDSQESFSDFKNTSTVFPGEVPSENAEPGGERTYTPLVRSDGLFLSLKNLAKNASTSIMEAELNNAEWHRLCAQFGQAFVDVWSNLPRLVRDDFLRHWSRPDLYARLGLEHQRIPRVPVIELVDDVLVARGGCVCSADGIVVTFRYAWRFADPSLFRDIIALGLADAYSYIDSRIVSLRDAMIDIPMRIWDELHLSPTENDRDRRMAELVLAFHLRRQEETAHLLNCWGFWLQSSEQIGPFWLRPVT